jgi:hypothetical protein
MFAAVLAATVGLGAGVAPAAVAQATPTSAPAVRVQVPKQTTQQVLRRRRFRVKVWVSGPTDYVELRLRDREGGVVASTYADVPPREWTWVSLDVSGTCFYRLPLEGRRVRLTLHGTAEAYAHPIGWVPPKLKRLTLKAPRHYHPRKLPAVEVTGVAKSSTRSREPASAVGKLVREGRRVGEIWLYCQPRQSYMPKSEPVTCRGNLKFKGEGSIGVQGETPNEHALPERWRACGLADPKGGEFEHAWGRMKATRLSARRVRIAFRLFRSEFAIFQERPSR